MVRVCDVTVTCSIMEAIVRVNGNEITGSVEEIQNKLLETQDKFDRVCRQIVSLSHQISCLKKLYRRAENNNKYAIRYNIRMRMSIISGIKMMYHHYATIKAEEINQFRNTLAELRDSSQSNTSSWTFIKINTVNPTDGKF